MANVIFVDNQDSFTYNIVDELKKLNHNVVVYRNTVSTETITSQIDSKISEGTPVVLFFSPGPGKPSEVPLMTSLLDRYKGKIPVIGVCLGHQAITEYYGGSVDIAGETVHGKSSKMTIQQHPIFNTMPNPLVIARYHSLVAKRVPATLTIIGQLESMPMALINEEDRVLGFQFHPESVLTTNGTTLLKQSIEYLLR